MNKNKNIWIPHVHVNTMYLHNVWPLLTRNGDEKQNPFNDPNLV